MAEDNGQRHTEEFYGQLVERANSDPAFRERLRSNPVAAIREQGFDIPEGIQVRVIEPDEEEVCLILPPQVGGEVTEVSGYTSSSSFRAVATPQLRPSASGLGSSFQVGQLAGRVPLPLMVGNANRLRAMCW